MLSEQLNLDTESEKEKNYVGAQVRYGSNINNKNYEKNVDNTLILDDLGQPSRQVFNSNSLFKNLPEPRKENNQNNKNNLIDDEEFNKMIEDLNR